MSTHYRPLERVRASDLFGGRLENFGIREHINDETNQTAKCLTDGRNYVWVYVDQDGFIDSLCRYGLNSPRKVLNAVADAFDTDIVSEYDPQYWGFETHEEWDAFQQKLAKEEEDRFYIEILKFVRGEPNEIGPGTIGETEAGIAKALIEQDASLLLPINKEKLLTEINSIYDRDHAVVITLDPKDKAFVEMIATHEDDLPKA
jgi:hypothetical protein